MIVMPECLLANRTLQVVFRGQQLGQIKLKHDLGAVYMRRAGPASRADSFV
jgi:hypothetical protein